MGSHSLDRVAGEVLSEQVALGQRAGWSEGSSHGNIWGKLYKYFDENKDGPN